MPEPLTIYSRTWPGKFLADYNRTGESIWLFLFLLVRADPETGYFRASFRRVAEETGVSVVKLKQWLEQLEGEGYVRDESLNNKLIVRLVQ